MSRGLPVGFTRLTLRRHVEVVVAEYVADAVLAAMRDGTLFDYGARHPEARTLAGRGVAYAVPLPNGVERVVIRHNRHGGMLARFTGDIFAPPTRAPHELQMSEWLRQASVPTPAFLGYAVYPAAVVFRRSDVMTREVPDSADLSNSIMSPDTAVRRRALQATASLVRALSDVGARHHDLNVKNVLLRRDEAGGLTALLLDVDRVERVGAVERALEPNIARLIRSARKWRERYGAPVTESELQALAVMVRESDFQPDTFASVRS